jgi:hypothetical protein
MMGLLASRADALALEVQGAVGSSVAILIGADPTKIAGQDYPEFVCIVPTGAPHGPNILLNDVAQESEWSWSLYVGVGSGGIQEDAIDRIDILLEKLMAKSSSGGLLGVRLDSNCGPLICGERHEFEGWRPDGGVVYRQDWTHTALVQS